MKRLFLLKTLVILLCFISGCGTTNVYIKGRRWADINIGHIKHIVILNFNQTKIAEIIPKGKEEKEEGKKGEISVTKHNLENWGEKVSNILIEELRRQEYYKIIERSKINKLLEGQKFTLTGMEDKNVVKDVGKLLGVEAIIFGNVEAFCIDTRGKEYVEKEIETGKYHEVTTKNLLSGKKYQSQGEIRKKKLVLEDYLLREVNLSIDLHLINIETGNIMEVLSKSSSHQTKAVGSFQITHIPSCESIGKNLTNNMINHLVKKLSPHYVIKIKTLEYGKDKEKIVKLGVTYAKKDLWEEAFKQWNKALEINPENTSAYNNLGIYYERKGLFQEALKVYKEALRLDPFNKVYRKNLCEIKKEIAEQEKTRRQQLEKGEKNSP